MRSIALAVLVACAATGCMSQQQQLAEKQPTAVATALQRARFDLNCPTATGTVLSSDFIQPALQGPWVEGMTRVEYTIGVEGCGQRTTYIVIRQEGPTPALPPAPTAASRAPSRASGSGGPSRRASARHPAPFERSADRAFARGGPSCTPPFEPPRSSPWPSA